MTSTYDRLTASELLAIIRAAALVRKPENE